jgi:FdhD protein
MAEPAPQPQPEGAARRQLGSGRWDLLVREEPLMLVVHGQQLLTMRTPGRDEDLAVGFLLGEGIVLRADAIAQMQAQQGDPEAQRTDELHITLRSAPDPLAKSRLARTHEIRSSCGVCGLADPATVLDGTPPLLPGVPKVAVARIQELVQELQRRQELFAATGGCHGALVASGEGTVLGFGEDVGRHNALDKAIGQAARAGAEFAHSIAVLSGRAGFDLVVKCLRVRLPVMVSISAPSALAFDLCSAAGATLVGFARGLHHEVYCGAERLIP